MKRIEEKLIIEEEELKEGSELTGEFSGASPTSSEVKVKLPKLEITII